MSEMQVIIYIVSAVLIFTLGVVAGSRIKTEPVRRSTGDVQEPQRRQYDPNNPINSRGRM